MKTKAPLSWFLLAGGLLLAGCNYDFPLTEKPTRAIDPRLLGNWVSFDKDDQKLEQMSVRQLDGNAYVVAMDGDLYRVTHSDIGDAALVSVQDLQPGEFHGKYAYYAWELSADGRQLSVKGVRTKIVPEDTKDAAAAQKLIRDNLANPDLYGEPKVFTPQKR
ncbi:MAG TPA: hypothetical protein VL200_12175 [Lacunisphaera sp.]|jgi:hypothetical protein|nr:hypothetical protein [Lacunisphaera sp.]